MSIVWLIIFGFLSGIIGGMGMGGGTILIPLLVIFGEVEQHLAQSINLIVFLPLSLVALIIHFKNKLVDIKSSILIIIPAMICAILGAIFVQNIDGNNLKMYFGIFLTILGLIQFISVFYKSKIEKAKTNPPLLKCCLKYQKHKTIKLLTYNYEAQNNLLEYHLE